MDTTKHSPEIEDEYEVDDFSDHDDEDLLQEIGLDTATTAGKERSLGMMLGMKRDVKYRGRDVNQLTLGVVDNSDNLFGTKMSGAQLMLFDLRNWILIKLFYGVLSLTIWVDLQRQRISELVWIVIDIGIRVLNWINFLGNSTILFQFMIPRTNNEIIESITNASLVYPETIAVLINTPIFNIPPPEPIPEPYLNADKKLIVPSKSEISIAIESHLRYRQSLKIFRQELKIDVLIKMSKMICYCYILPKIKMVQLYHYSGFIWGAGAAGTLEQGLSPEQGDILCDCIITELKNFLGTTTNDNDKNLINCRDSIKLINFNKKKNYVINSMTLTYEEEDIMIYAPEKIPISEVSNSLIISLLSSRQDSKLKYVENLQKKMDLTYCMGFEKELLTLPDLLIDFDLGFGLGSGSGSNGGPGQDLGLSSNSILKQFKKFYCLKNFTYYPHSEDDDPDVLLYREPGYCSSLPVSKIFINGLKFYSTEERST